MVPDKVLYTDGHGVTVTDSSLKVRDKIYAIRGIIHHGLWTIRASRGPAVAMIVLGVISLLLGLLGFVSPFVPDFIVNGDSVSSDALATGLGIFLLVMGIVWIAVARDKYAVRISTAEGERNAVVSTKKEYVNQIVSAINDAFSMRRDVAVDREVYIEDKDVVIRRQSL